MRRAPATEAVRVVLTDVRHIPARHLPGDSDPRTARS
ncbi:hypothetical protein SCYAM73S_07271 [Streptomyces cyaneofuscatus]